MKKNKNNKIKLIVIMTLVMALVQIFIFYTMDSFRGPVEEDFVDKLFAAYGYLILVAISFLVHVPIHELGHLVFGYLSKYSFVSFRIGSLTLIKQNGKLRLKKYKLPGTGGQCLMMPPEYKEGDFPFILYNLGGGLFNLIFSFIFIALSLALKGRAYPYDFTLLLFGIGGILIALVNLIPMNAAGIPNDGHNLRSMIKDQSLVKKFYIQLRTNGLLNDGIRIKDMDLEDFIISPDSDIGSPFNSYFVFIHHQWYLDNMDFDKAKEVLDNIFPNLHKFISLYRFEAKKERIFLELIGENNIEFIERHLDKDLEKYTKATSTMLSTKRFQMAYEAFYNDDKEKALKIYDEIIKKAHTYPLEGEADMEIMLADYLKDRIEFPS